MMELTCAFILLSASLVLATPHGYGGYGVKGGASARAESSASGGNFGPIPVAVPLAAGYSGSFSKSSSSSSASSSASSSSSSSSFSFGGSGAGGFGIHGGAPGIGGCSTGSCQNGGENGLQTPHGSSAQGHNSANAAASAQAGAVSGLGCQGSSCGGNSEKCTSGSCKSGNTAVDSDSNKCTSGQCGSAFTNGASLTDDSSNDIRVVSGHNAAHNGADTNCFNGKCGPSSLKPNHNGHESGNSYLDSSASNNQQGSSSNFGVTSHYQKPSTHLETPIDGSKCSSGNCNSGLGEHGHVSSPSSYNVPIHGAYNKDESKPTCDGVKCDNQPNAPYSPTDNSVTKGPSSFDYPTSTNCVGSSCFGSPASQVTGGPSGTVKPGSNNFGQSPSHVPSNVAPGHIGPGKPSNVNSKLPNDKLPPYTGGFGGPAGVLNPNDVPVLANPNDGKPLGNTPAGCNSPSCSGHPSTSRPTSGLAPTGTNNRPGGDIPSDELPTYTGGFGGPAGTLKPDGFGVHATVTNKPPFAHSGNPSYNTQPAGNFGAPGCKVGENCGGYSPTAGATAGATAPSGHYGTTKPSHGIHSPNDKLPSYTGGFGGPGGVLNPDKYDIPANGPSSPGYTPSGTYSTPTPSGHPGGCKTPNCYPAFGSTAATESFGVSKPGSGPHFSSVTLPAYTSSYNTPSGVHRPNEISSPASTPSFTYTQSPSSPGSYSPDCKTGNCGKYPTGGPSASAPNQPQYTGGFGGPSGTFKPDEYNSPGCKSGNCGSYPASGPSASANAQPGAFGVTGTGSNTGVHSAAGNNLQYTGGFSGPSGTFKPDEPDSPGCKSGNCGINPISGPSAGAHAQPGAYSVTKPNADAAPNQPQYTGGFGGPSGTVKPDEHSSPGCKSGNCGSYPASGPSAGANTQPGAFGVTGTGSNTGVHSAAGNNLQYTGGFSGPSGTFKPDEHDSPGCKSGNCGINPISGSSAGAHAQPGAYGVTKPNADAVSNQPQYTGGFGGPSGTVKPDEHSSPGCKSGNCGSYPASGPSAGANTQPGAFGVTGTGSNTGVHSAAGNNLQYTGGFSGPSGTYKPDEHNSPGCKSGNCGSNPISGPSAGAHVQLGAYGVTKPNADAAPNQPQYTGGFGGPTGTFKPDEHNSPDCKSGNCGSYPTSGPSAGTNAHPGSFGITGIGSNTGVHSAAGNNLQYTGGFRGPSGTYKPDEHNSPGCKSGNCGSNPTSGPLAGANAQPEAFGVTGPNAGVNTAASHQSHYTGGFIGSSGTLKPGEHGYVTPSTSGATTNCGTPNCIGSPTGNAQAASGANAQIGSFGVTKPGDVSKSSDEKPTYSGGFGGAPGLLKPNEFTVPAVTLSPLNKPAGVSTPTACTSGNCNSQAPHSSAPHAHHGASSGAHATAAATAEANAVAYTGGFGGPPGVLTPFDDGKIGTLPTIGAQGHGLQVDGVHGSHNANIHSQHGVIPGAAGSSTGLAGAIGNTGAQAGSAAGAAAYAGAAAGASAGANGYNPHGSYNHAGNVKGGSPCGGGCGGSAGGAFNGGSTLDISGGHGFPKLLADGLNGAGSASGATAKSLSGANAFGFGGSFASSSASSHASSGAYTKGGYGKR